MSASTKMTKQQREKNDDNDAQNQLEADYEKMLERTRDNLRKKPERLRRRILGGPVQNVTRIRGRIKPAPFFGNAVERDTRGRDERERVHVRVLRICLVGKRGKKCRFVHVAALGGRARTVSDKRRTGWETGIYRGVLVDENNDRE